MFCHIYLDLQVSICDTAMLLYPCQSTINDAWLRHKSLIIHFDNAHFWNKQFVILMQLYFGNKFL